MQTLISGSRLKWIFFPSLASGPALQFRMRNKGNEEEMKILTNEVIHLFNFSVIIVHCSSIIGDGHPPPYG
jgi:hypothetical protein